MLKFKQLNQKSHKSKRKLQSLKRKLKCLDQRKYPNKIKLKRLRKSLNKEIVIITLNKKALKQLLNKFWMQCLNLT